MLFAIQLLKAQTQHAILPSITDANTVSPNYSHFVYIDGTVTQKNKLFLFFPGTGGAPFLYREILKEAARLGYHAIGLSYTTAESINEDICGGTTDTTCHSRARYEIFDGTDRHDSLSVDTNNCIQHRTIKLLQYLQGQYPSENWAQYFTGDSITWSKIIVSGHSQGGGHAGFISKIREVDRVVMFAATDRIPLLQRDADWISWNGTTPSNRYYGFTHQHDQSVPFLSLQDTWTNYGLFNYGSLVLTDTATYPFGNSHTLYTLLTPVNDSTQFHNCIVVDQNTPFDTNGIAVLKPVWDYLIDSPIALAINKPKVNLDLFHIYPNPAQNIIIIDSQLQIFSFAIFDIAGRIIYSKKNSRDKTQIDCSNFSNGIYFIQLTNGNKFFNQKIIVTK